jgi:hypothetical protein
MCTIIAKKFPNIGWVGIKNRDRPTASRTELLREKFNNIERVTLRDENTHWSEGSNNFGVNIISSSLTPVESTSHISINGEKIRKALKESTVEAAVQSLKLNKVTGCVMIFNTDQLWLIEGQVDNHNQIIKHITDDRVVRTNHGIWLPTAGYQISSNNIIESMRRLSSEARYKIGKYVVDIATDFLQIMPLLAHTWSTNTQLTTLRKPLDQINTRTTEQLMLIPKQKIMLVRNVDGILAYNQKMANLPNSQILVGIVEN